MPLFEYTCSKCHKEFEILVTASTELKCPYCKAAELTKKFSTFSSKQSGPASSCPMPEMPHCHTGGCCGSGMCGLE